MQTINVCGVRLDIHTGHIGCSLSGGADSALLGYLLLKHATGPITFYTTNHDEFANRTEGAISVYHRLLDMTQRQDTTHIITDIYELQNRENLFLRPIRDVESGKINMMYTGITRNPPSSIDLGPNTGMKVRDHDGNIPEYAGPDKKFYTPWVNHDKSKLAEIYKSLNLIDSLYSYTCSCVTYNIGADHCGECWWCRERLWAFGKL